MTEYSNTYTLPGVSIPELPSLLFQFVVDLSFDDLMMAFEWTTGPF